MIVFGTLFIYAVELSDGDLPERDQTIVSQDNLSLFLNSSANMLCTRA